MLRHSIIAACALPLGLSSAALAQTSDTTSTVSKTFAEPGIVQAISPTDVTVRDSNGIETYPVTQGLEFRMNGKDVGIDQLKPGMKVTAEITDQVTTHDVTVTKVLDGKVVQFTPNGFVVLDSKDRYVPYDFTDAQGNDLHYRAPDGRDTSLRNVKLGEHLTGTLVTRFPAQVVAARSVMLDGTPRTAVSAVLPALTSTTKPASK